MTNQQSEFDELLDQHDAFLECRPVERPLIRAWRSGYYPAEQFPRAASRWRDGDALRADEVSFASFQEDYECLYQACEEDFGYLASAYWGIPWLEAVMGCPVTVTAMNCRAASCLPRLANVDNIPLDLDHNPWLTALVRFTQELAAFSAGRFPVCPPLLRGPGDVAAAILGEMRYITGFFDAPEEMRKLLDQCARVRLAVLERLRTAIPAWQGIHAAGGYPSAVWARRTVAYHQEDSAAVLSPSLFREFLLPAIKTGCHAAEVNFVHLHSACLYPVDILLEDSSFNVLQINVDHKGAGPPVQKLVAVFKTIQDAGRPLLLWGEFGPDDWELIRSELRPVGLSLQPIVREGKCYAW